MKQSPFQFSGFSATTCQLLTKKLIIKGINEIDPTVLLGHIAPYTMEPVNFWLFPPHFVATLFLRAVYFEGSQLFYFYLLPWLVLVTTRDLKTSTSSNLQPFQSRFSKVSSSTLTHLFLHSFIFFPTHTFIYLFNNC